MNSPRPFLDRSGMQQPQPRPVDNSLFRSQRDPLSTIVAGPNDAVNTSTHSVGSAIVTPSGGIIDVHKVAQLVKQLAEARFQQRQLEATLREKERAEQAEELVDSPSSRSHTKKRRSTKARSAEAPKVDSTDISFASSGKHKQTREAAHPSRHSSAPSSAPSFSSSPSSSLSSTSSLEGVEAAHAKKERKKKAVEPKKKGMTKEAAAKTPVVKVEDGAPTASAYWRHQYNALKRKYHKGKDRQQKDLQEIHFMIQQMDAEQDVIRLERENGKLQDRIFNLTHPTPVKIVEDSRVQYPARPQADARYLAPQQDTHQACTPRSSPHPSHTPKASPYPPQDINNNSNGGALATPPGTLSAVQPIPPSSVQALPSPPMSLRTPVDGADVRQLQEEVSLWRARCLKLLDATAPIQTSFDDGQKKGHANRTPNPRSPTTAPLPNPLHGYTQDTSAETPIHMRPHPLTPPNISLHASPPPQQLQQQQQPVPPRQPSPVRRSSPQEREARNMVQFAELPSEHRAYAERQNPPSLPPPALLEPQYNTTGTQVEPLWTAPSDARRLDKITRETNTSTASSKFNYQNLHPASLFFENTKNVSVDSSHLPSYCDPALEEQYRAYYQQEQRGAARNRIEQGIRRNDQLLHALAKLQRAASQCTSVNSTTPPN